jgi:DNA-binding MarR family transcriptional regulator
MVLNALAQNQEPHNAARVVDLLAQAPVAIEALIDGLVKHGLAYRSGDTSINLTPAGAMRHASLRETLQDVSQTVLAAVDASELETARRVLETVTERAKELAATG